MLGAQCFVLFLYISGQTSFAFTTSDWRTNTPSTTGCGTRYFYNKDGSLFSPNYPNKYPDNLHCEYYIQPSEHVYLRVMDLYLETCCDHLRIYDEYGTETWVSNDTSRLLYGRSFRVAFTTDGSVQSRGFKIRWSKDYIYEGSTAYPVSTPANSFTQCGGYYKADYVVLESPGYPDYYPNNAYCTYTIESQREVELQVRVLNLQPGFDFLQVRVLDGYNHNGLSFTGFNTSDISPIRGRHLTVVFTTDDSIQLHAGFRIVIEPVHEPFIQGSTPYYNARSTDWRNYWTTPPAYGPYRTTGYWRWKDNTDETTADYRWQGTTDYRWWQGITGTTGYRRWQDRTTADYRWQGTTDNRIPYQTTGYRSWQGSTEDISPVCGGDYRANDGVIESPHYSIHNYPNNVECWYNIYTTRRAKLEVTDFDLEQNYDTLTLLGDRGNNEWTVTGHNSGQVFYKYSDHFRLRFKTDHSNTRRGFRVVWHPDDGYQPYYGPYNNSTSGYWWWQGNTDQTTVGYWWQGTTGISNRITVNCNPRNLNVVVQRDLIRQMFPGISEYDLSLNTPSCRGRVYNNVVIFDSSILGCGMTREETQNQMIYRNRIHSTSGTTSYTTPYYNWFTTEGTLITRFDSNIEVECCLDKYVSAVGYFHPHGSHQLVARGYSNFSVNMDFYRDHSYNYRVTSYPFNVGLNEDVYVDLRLDSGDPSLKLSIESCYASSSDQQYYTSYRDRYYLIRYGCPEDPTVALEVTGNQHAHFRFRSFEFLRRSGNVYIHCDAKVCNNTDYYSRCYHNCNNRHRRDVAEEETHDFSIFQGPVTFRNKRSSDVEAEGQMSKRDDKTSGFVPAVVMGVSACAMVIAAVVMVVVKKRHATHNREERVI